jgi:hypothetical protein
MLWDLFDGELHGFQGRRVCTQLPPQRPTRLRLEAWKRGTESTDPSFTATHPSLHSAFYINTSTVVEDFLL